MIGFVPISELAPLDYRYALDASMPTLARVQSLRVRCHVPQLLREIRQRIPGCSEEPVVEAALWVEPMLDTWREDLKALAHGLPAGGQLVVIASQPLARLLPERAGWCGQPVVLALSGMIRLQRALAHTGFILEASYGVHALSAIGLNLLGQQMARRGRADLGDRLHFAARLRYCSHGLLVPLATVALLFARKGAPNGCSV
jgi:hypothetical protein